MVPSKTYHKDKYSYFSEDFVPCNVKLINGNKSTDIEFYSRTVVVVVVVVYLPISTYSIQRLCVAE